LPFDFPKEDEPFIRNAISRHKSVHEPIVRRPAHPRRLVGVLVIGRVAAKPQAQLASAPEATSNKWPEVSGFLQGLSLHAAVLQSPDGAP
jgi:hypothetical protein